VSLTSYSDLQVEVTQWLRRPDLAGEIPTFITLAEAQLNRRLKTLYQMARTTLSIDAEYVAYPADFNGLITLDLQTAPVTRLKYIGPDGLTDLTATRYANPAKPLYFSVIGADFRFWPAPDTAYTGDLTYTQSIPALSASNTSNWLLTNHPDAYLYGALMQAAPYLKSDERLQTWAGLFTQVIDDINRNDDWRMLGAQPARRPRSFG
jgi:hypothetical protein